MKNISKLALAQRGWKAAWLVVVALLIGVDICAPCATAQAVPSFSTSIHKALGELDEASYRAHKEGWKLESGYGGLGVFVTKDNFELTVARSLRVVLAASLNV